MSAPARRGSRATKARRNTAEPAAFPPRGRGGHRNGGVVPFGYRRVYAPRGNAWVLVREPREGGVIQTIFRAYLRMGSLGKLVEWLAMGGIRTRGGKPWSRAALAFVLGNETYLGRLRKGDGRGAARPPALVAPIVFHKVQQMKRRNAKRAPEKAGGAGRSQEPAARDG